LFKIIFMIHMFLFSCLSCYLVCHNSYLYF
jgi:hypothetical protein